MHFVWSCFYSAMSNITPNINNTFLVLWLFTLSFCLPKHPSAAQMLRDVGAVDFLTQLSPNVEPRLRAVIDGTLDQLFQLPELLPSHAMVYSHGQHTTAPTGVASYSQIIVCFDSVFYKLLNVHNHMQERGGGEWCVLSICVPHLLAVWSNACSMQHDILINLMSLFSTYNFSTWRGFS